MRQQPCVAFWIFLHADNSDRVQHIIPERAVNKVNNYRQIRRKKSCVEACHLNADFKSKVIIILESPKRKKTSTCGLTVQNKVIQKTFISGSKTQTIFNTFCRKQTQSEDKTRCGVSGEMLSSIAPSEILERGKGIISETFQ